MNYNFSVDEKRKIIARFGNGFYEKLIKLTSFYAEKWNMELLSLVDYFSVNCIFICRSKIYSDAVMKISSYPKEVLNEINALKEYNGRGFCKIYDYDDENGVILIEKIEPGLRLRCEKSLEKRLEIFSNLFKKIHIEPENAEIYPSYYQWVKRIKAYMEKRDDYIELYGYIEMAQKICGRLCEKYNKSVLLHGDFHHDNILMTQNGEYKIIDPKGVVGDPIFDTPRFILNEFYEEENVSFAGYKKRVEDIAAYFEKSLGIAKEIIYSCVFIETAMANCWMVESGENPEMDMVRNSWRLLK